MVADKPGRQLSDTASGNGSIEHRFAVAPLVPSGDEREFEFTSVVP
jgi:hypothetical protein